MQSFRTIRIVLFLVILMGSTSQGDEARARNYGPELDALIQQARSDFTAGRIDVALTGYSVAEKRATEKGESELAMELGFTRGSILLDGLRIEEASAEFLRLTSQFPKQPSAAKSHLLGTYCLGRLYDEKKTQTRREAYTQELDRHLNDYSWDPTINDARFMKAQLEEQRLQATVALPLYLQVEAVHARAPEAMAGSARCYEAILRRMRERRLSTDELEQEAITRLSAFLSIMGESRDSWTAIHADIALRLAAILLMGPGNPDPSIDPKRSSPGRATNANDPPYAARCAQAARWLNRVALFTDRKDPEKTSADVTERLRCRAAPLQFLVLAGSGKTSEADRSIDSISASPTEMLSVLERLTEFVIVTRGEQRGPIALLQIQVAERLLAQREQLSAADRESFDRYLVRAYVSAGRTANAVEYGSQLAERSAKDMDRQHEIAALFAEVSDAGAQSLSNQCWQRIEFGAKTGSPEWMAARVGILKASIALNQLDEARKLLQATKVLYPELGGDPLKSQFDAIEKELQSPKRK